MSNVLYPLGLIQQLEIERLDRTLRDEFEAGNTAARSYWSAQNFKRKFTVSHAPLKAAEYKYLRSFNSQRGGQYDAFWFRDNITRGGNASVRFATQLKEARAAMLAGVKIDLEEVAPIRALPEFDELSAAAGVAPVAWYDPNREYYLQHLASVIREGSTWDVMEAYRAVWQSGTALNLGDLLTQYQHYHFSGTEWAKTAASLTPLSGTNPAVTVFFIARHSASTNSQVLFAVGTQSSGNALGVMINSSSQYELWKGVATGLVQANSPANTWRSLAFTLEPSTKIWTNGTSVYSGAAVAYNLSGPLVLGANFDGTFPMNPGNAMANADLAHVLYFPGQLSDAQIKAVHNLLGYQYGLPIA